MSKEDIIEVLLYDRDREQTADDIRYLVSRIDGISGIEDHITWLLELAVALEEL